MRYHLMTGATGLLGHYLLKDALLNGIELAVIARGTRDAAARQRIDDSLVRWEQKLGRHLPRPVVLEGDMTRPFLGLDASQRQWVKSNCRSVLHNAASLTFYTKPNEDEPYASNVGGTQNVLQLCREAGITDFHHVSTAYVCGLREGTILETETDVGQTLGNDYEKSKIAAEKLVVEANFLDQVTIYRPGIIIGDSVTGYTSTFHGFYVPLKIAYGLGQTVVLPKPDAISLVQLLGMTGSETKNFVPVDWVSAAMMHIMARREHHGRCYHLTPAKPTSLVDMIEVFQEALAEIPPSKRPFNTSSLDGMASVLETQMSAYQAYWRDDPTFDRTNTLAACQSLPCPDVDRGMLKRTSLYALKAGFGWPKPPSLAADPQLDLRLDGGTPVSPRDERHDGSLNVQVAGPGGGQWNLQMQGMKVVGIDSFPHSHAQGDVFLNRDTFQQLLSGVTTCETAVREGAIVLRGKNAKQLLAHATCQLSTAS